MRKAWFILTCTLILAFMLGLRHADMVVQSASPVTDTVTVSSPSLSSPIPYREYFEAMAPLIGWKWQMLAAVAYHESRFNPAACSYAGARGLMQLMPVTAGHFGLNDSTIWEPEDNIRAGVHYIQYLQKQWHFITNTDEQNRFVLASYNLGPATIMSARKNAMEEGAEGSVWSQVEPYVKSGATRAYVKNVIKTTNEYRNDTSER